MGNNLKFAQYNNILFKKLSVFINHEADFIRPEFIESLCRDCDISKEEAYCFTLAAAIDLDTEKIRAMLKFLKNISPIWYTFSKTKIMKIIRTLKTSKYRRKSFANGSFVTKHTSRIRLLCSMIRK